MASLTFVAKSTLTILALTSFSFSVASPSDSLAQDNESQEAAGQGDEETWDVQNPPGPYFDITIDADEGTWMCLDVRPDGEEIVFDFLGDIYVVPFEGGEARPLTSGIAWDEQPRFSPDGRYIAFTSDRGGGDNIWTLDREGGDLTQVTEESFRLLNSPVWTPDGEYIAARKHFTSTRSAGAGEIWLYHRTGGQGLQMTKRPNDQKDLGEPAFSPDGRYLYYSQDVTPGSRFEYNKDPNGTIYAIQRLDRETGHTERFVSGRGGSIRPTPSPDGKSLAFIRRIRSKSVLFVRDVASGEETPLFDGLDRDLQETWAIHGVYPSMAWTPDSKSIVFWSGGKIRSLAIESREIAEIPFHVFDQRKVAQRVMVENDPAPPAFHTKMLRWVQVSPDEKKVAYQALGHIYVKGLPDGEPKRLTKQNDHFEFYPSWSRDGKNIVYTTWDDQDLGSVRVVPSRGGNGRVLTREPGHYVEPVFSPGGETVVYRKVGGGYLRSPQWSSGPGVYRVSAKGGEPELVRRQGYSPQFGAEAGRVYLVDVGGDDDDSRTLVSVRLDGGEERKHLHGIYFTDVSLSPNGRWVAFAEGFKAYVMPLVSTGKEVEFGPKSESLPVKRVAKDAGNYLHWSGGGEKLYWSLGPVLYERNMSEVFDFVPGSPEELPEPEDEGLDIGFDVEADVPSGSVAFVGADILTMRGTEVIQDGVVLVVRNRIAEVGRIGQVELPEGALVIDVSGKSIMPGLVDVHWHGGMGMHEMAPEQNWELYATLAYGVTTIHDPSNDTSEIFAAAEMAAAGSIVAPRIFSTGTILYGAKYDFKAEIDNLEDARHHLRRLKAVGAISVKSYNQPRRDQRQQVLTAARELDLLVYPEGGSLFQHNLNMVVDGHTGIEHSIPIARVYEDVLQLWGQTEVGYTPTLVVGYGGLWGEEYWYSTTKVWENERLLTFAPRDVIDARSRRRNIVPEEEWGHFYNAREAKRLLDAGVKVQIGAHGQREGLGAHWETWMLRQGEMTHMQALQCATIRGAEYLGMEDAIGTIEEGKLADFIVLDGNPINDMRNTQNLVYTVLNGRVYEAATMNEVGNHPRERAEFYWEHGLSALGTTEAQLEYRKKHACAGGCTVH